MVVDLNYGATVNKKFVQEWWQNGGKDDPKAAITIMATATNVPCINIVYWIGEVENWASFLKEKADIIVDFYGYTEIINKVEGCPW